MADKPLKQHKEQLIENFYLQKDEVEILLYRNESKNSRIKGKNFKSKKWYQIFLK